MNRYLVLLLILMLPPLQAAQPPLRGKAEAGAMVEWRDPMQPPPFALRQYRLEKRKQKAVASAAKPAARPKTWTLNSILHAPGRQRAIINGRLLAVGDRIDGARVIAIDRDRVRLSRQGKTIILKLETARLDLKKTRTR